MKDKVTIALAIFGLVRMTLDVLAILGAAT